MTANTLVACLESYINPALPIGTAINSDDNAPALHLLPSTTLSKLKNVGPARVKDMRALGQAKQILSHVPVAATPATCTKFNDTLGSVIQMNQEKFAALAILPPEGKEAAKELQRCVVKMRFVGGVVGLRSDDRGGLTLGTDMEELWSTAAKFRVPVMLRVMWPVGAQVSFFRYGSGSED
jgi:predicted TIM-barrel fold metal-dependent hydrolase